MRLCAPCLPLLPLAAALVLGAPLAPAPARADEPAPAAPSPHATPCARPCAGPRAPWTWCICLDTSGSMQGLIDAARRKLWSVVSELATAKPMPDAARGPPHLRQPRRRRRGLRGAPDAVHDRPRPGEREALRARNERRRGVRGARGGPRARRPGLDLGATRSSSSSSPATSRPTRTASSPSARWLARAAERGVIVNAIYCGGPDDGDAAGWREVALLGKGRFASIDKDHGTVAIVTPFDQELAALSLRLNGTYVAYGREGRRAQGAPGGPGQERRRRGCRPRPPSAPPPRPSDLYDNHGWDLVDRLQKDAAFDLAHAEGRGAARGAAQRAGGRAPRLAGAAGARAGGPARADPGPGPQAPGAREGRDGAPAPERQGRAGPRAAGGAARAGRRGGPHVRGARPALSPPAGTRPPPPGAAPAAGRHCAPGGPSMAARSARPPAPPLRAAPRPPPRSPPTPWSARRRRPSCCPTTRG